MLCLVPSGIVWLALQLKVTYLSKDKSMTSFYGSRSVCFSLFCDEKLFHCSFAAGGSRVEPRCCVLLYYCQIGQFSTEVALCVEIWA